MSRQSLTKFYRRFAPIKQDSNKFVKRDATVPPTENRFFQVHPKLKPRLLSPGQIINVKKEAKRQGITNLRLK